MNHALKLHPASVCDSVARIDVEVTRTREGVLQLKYAAAGRIDELRLPTVTAPARTDELWRHTCFEAFIRAAPDVAYAEFNFAPSTQWAACRFSAYREGMTIASEIAAPRIDVQSNAEVFSLRASLDLAPLKHLRRNASWRLGISAVIEEANGRKSYWALAHPPGKPDFHHSDSFALELGAPRA